MSQAGRPIEDPGLQRLSVPVAMSNAEAASTRPRACLPNLPGRASNRPRTLACWRARASRARPAAARRRCPKHQHRGADLRPDPCPGWQESRRLRASDRRTGSTRRRAARRPETDPARPSSVTSDSIRLPELLNRAGRAARTGPGASVSAGWPRRAASTTPPTVRSVSGSSPDFAPSVASKMPTRVNDRASPAPSANGPPAVSIHRRADQHRHERQYARRERRQRARQKSQSVGGGPEVHEPDLPPSGHGVSQSAARFGSCVSPVERATSLPSLNTTMVLCWVTPSERFSAFSVSKFGDVQRQGSEGGLLRHFLEHRRLSAAGRTPVGVKHDGHGFAGWHASRRIALDRREPRRPRRAHHELEALTLDGPRARAPLERRRLRARAARTHRGDARHGGALRRIRHCVAADHRTSCPAHRAIDGRTAAFDMRPLDRRVIWLRALYRALQGQGQPAVSLPLSVSRSGLPIGIQFAALLGADARLIALSAWLERERQWSEVRSRRPSPPARSLITRPRREGLSPRRLDENAGQLRRRNAAVRSKIPDPRGIGVLSRTRADRGSGFPRRRRACSDCVPC